LKTTLLRIENMDNGTAFQKLVDTVTRLRAPNGCAWDRQQSPDTIKDCILEESYELLEAVSSGDHAEVAEECGDLLFLIIFLSRMYEEKSAFTISRMLQTINSKMIRRHPHVFSDTEVNGVNEILKNWDQIKATESSKQGRTSRLDGVPLHMPALSRAVSLQKKASKCGFDWADEQDILDKIKEEIDELETALSSGRRRREEEEFGDLLFSLVNLARRQGIDPESALTVTNRKFIERFKYIEARGAALNRPLEEMSLKEMDRYWDEAKKSAVSPEGDS